MYKTLLATLLTLLTLHVAAQPKWLKKARKSQLNIITYDAAGQLLHSTNGFLVGNEGTAITDYTSFRGAERAVAIDEKGKEYPVTAIEGASSLYDVIRLHIDGIKASPLPLASSHAAKGENAYVMPYLSNKSGVGTEIAVSDVANFEQRFAYYTLPIRPSEKSASCPVMNAQGEVLGILQMSAKTDEQKCYAISADYVLSLSITALSATASDYRDLLIRKALPADASQAASFIYLIGTRDTATYLAYVDDYIRLLPDQSNGYTMKAEMLAAQQLYTDADAVWQQALDAKVTADDIHYSRARTIFAAAQANKQPDNWTLDQALQEAETAFNINPQPVFTALEGHILYAQKQYAEACRKFLDVNKTKMRSPDNFLYAAQCQQMLQDTAAVLAMQDSAVACFTKPYIESAAPALLMRAQTLLSLGRYRQAVADLNDYEHLKARQVNENFYYQRYQAEMQCRMFQQALSDIERAAKMAPQEPLFQAELAATHYRFNQLDEAISAARAAIALDNNFPDAHRILGICLRAQGKEAEARTALQQAAQLGDETALKLLNQKP